MSRRGRWALFVIVGSALAAFFVVRAVWFPGRAFDAVLWRDRAEITKGVRLEMADRLIAQGTLYGKTRLDVVEMLGEPSQSGYHAAWDLVYWLGDERRYISIDSEWLVIRLDADGCVADYRLVTD